MESRLQKIRARRRWQRLVSWHRRVKDDCGTQLVELAIVLPILLLLFAATAEFGRYFYEYTTLAKSARAGTRFLTTSAVNAKEDGKARNIVVYGNEAGTGEPLIPSLTTANVVITREGGVPTLPQTVNIRISNFKHQPIFDLGKLTKAPSLSLNVDVKPSVTMRYLLTTPAT